MTGAICPDCRRNMLDAAGCTVTTLTLAGERHERRRYGTELDGADMAEHCHDCGASLGRVHHDGCDVELCPRCNGQLLVCGCNRPSIAPRIPRRRAA